MIVIIFQRKTMDSVSLNKLPGHLCEVLCYCCLVKVISNSCDPMGCILPGPSVHGISQARLMERVPFPSPGDLPDPGMEPVSPALAGMFFITKSQGKPVNSLGGGKSGTITTYQSPQFPSLLFWDL